MNTLFYDTRIAVESLMYGYSLAASKEFIDCADTQLTKLFIQQTGLKPGKNVCFSISDHYTGAPIYTSYVIPGSNFHGRKLLINLYVNHNWNPITIFWKSKAGRDYKLHDINIDCNDIEFWFEKLDTDLYIKQLYPGDKLPFKLKDLTYELVVTRLNIDCTVSMIVKKDAIDSIPVLVNQVNEFIEQYNESSEKKDRTEGVVHNAKSTIQDDNNIIYEIDLGSAGPAFFKKLLVYLSGMNVFSRVEIG